MISLPPSLPPSFFFPLFLFSLPPVFFQLCEAAEAAQGGRMDGRISSRIFFGFSLGQILSWGD